MGVPANQSRPLTRGRSESIGLGTEATGEATVAAMEREESFQDKIIREHVKGLSFVDFGGLWGILNEKVSVASLAGARSTAMADMQPLGNWLWHRLP